MMLSKRTARWLFTCVAVVLTTRGALAQIPADSGADYPGPGQSYELGGAPFAAGEPESWTHGAFPVSPGHVGSYAQPFAPAQTSEYGNGPRAHEGWFFGYQRLVWSLSQPESSFMGAHPIHTVPAFGTNFLVPANALTIDNSFIRAVQAWGNLWEIGYMDDTSYGWYLGILDHVSQGQYETKINPFITFGDPDQLLTGYVFVLGVPVELGQFPGVFETLLMRNITTLNGVEAMRTYRAPRLHRGGYFEVMYGVRWFQMVDGYEVWGMGNGESRITFGGIPDDATFPYNMLDESYWGTTVQNNLIGPQIGLRWFAQRGHWVTSVEGRFLAAANFQNVHQKAFLGTDTLTNRDGIVGPGGAIAFQGLATNSHVYNTTFSPMGELRVNVAYAATRNINLTVGYDGIIVGNVSRASNRVDYNSPNLVGITPKSNNEVFFVNGLNFGVTINR
jgi:hypothetical protein